MIYIQNKKTPNKDKPLALFHINACSLHKNSDYLQHLSCSNKKFDLIAITKIFLSSSPLMNPQQVVAFFILLIIYHINLAWT